MADDPKFDPLAIDECQSFTYEARRARASDEQYRRLLESFPKPKLTWVQRVNRHWGWKLLLPATIITLGYILSRMIDPHGLEEWVTTVLALFAFMMACGLWFSGD